MQIIKNFIPLLLYDIQDLLNSALAIYIKKRKIDIFGQFMSQSLKFFQSLDKRNIFLDRNILSRQKLLHFRRNTSLKEWFKLIKNFKCLETFKIMIHHMLLNSPQNSFKILFLIIHNL